MEKITLEDIFSYAHARVKEYFPKIKPLRFVNYDEDDARTCGYETEDSITIVIDRCLEFYGEATTSAQLATNCMGLLAHEFVGHSMRYGIIKNPSRFVLTHSSADKESMPYHVQYAVMGNQECIKKLEEHNNVWINYIMKCLVKVRDEVTRYLNERNPGHYWRKTA
jgi:hypothetical protein